jgi:lipopolysaccharide/colanic/teichoic acid biosynthesis glycosyltransferase
VKRLFDIFFSITGIICSSPVLLVVWILIRLESKGPAIFRQMRVGLNNSDFVLYKFRSMYLQSEKSGQLTVGMRDQRITKVGYYIRKYKLDELPQLFNVLNGSMSIVGPRPELRKYVNCYNSEQMRVLSVKPGITDYASLKYHKENELLGKSANPEKEYIEVIMPDKLTLNLKYINNKSLIGDTFIIIQTIVKIIL